MIYDPRRHRPTLHVRSQASRDREGRRAFETLVWMGFWLLVIAIGTLVIAQWQ